MTGPLEDEAEKVAERLKAGRSVTAALSLVMADLPGISKGDKSPEGYSYRGIEAITKQLQPLLAKHGVVFTPKARITDVRPSPAMKDGWQDVYMEVDWTIAGPDGSTLEARTTGIGRDRSDKGANKAQTQAFKYLLLHLLCIADVADDADGQTYEHDRATWTVGDAKKRLLSDVGADAALAKEAWRALDGDERWREWEHDWPTIELEAWVNQPASGEPEGTG